jgi:hypothetical protein
MRRRERCKKLRVKLNIVRLATDEGRDIEIIAKKLQRGLGIGSPTD